MSKDKQALITSRDPKGIAIIGLIEAALNKAKLDNDQAQRVFEHGGELQEDFSAALAKYGTPSGYANEEVSSEYGYLSGYREAKPVAEQMRILREYFPNLGNLDEEIVKQERPANSEGYFAIPRWQLIAPTYGEAVQKVLNQIKKTRDGKFYNYREGQLGPKYLRQSEKSARTFEKLGEEQKDHDILVVPAQFGIRHGGRSVRRAREVMNDSEFGLGAFAVGIMLLTHPERLQNYNDLWIDCAGDEFSPEADGDFSKAPRFTFFDGRVGFVAHWVGDAYDDFGSASGFVPQ